MLTVIRVVRGNDTNDILQFVTNKWAKRSLIQILSYVRDVVTGGFCVDRVIEGIYQDIPNYPVSGNTQAAQIETVEKSFNAGYIVIDFNDNKVTFGKYGEWKSVGIADFGDTFNDVYWIDINGYSFYETG